MKIDIKLDQKSYRQLESALKKMGDRAGGQVVVNAALAGAKEIEQAADSKAPAPHIISQVTDQGAGFAEVSIGPDSDHWYYKFFEFGASAHQITAKDASALVFQGSQGIVRIGRVSHPGMAARPFLRPAMTQQKSAATQAAGNEFKRILVK